MKNTPIRFLFIYSLILMASLVLVSVSFTIKDNERHHLDNKENSYMTGQWQDLQKPVLQPVSYSTTKPIDLKYVNPKRTIIF